MPSSEVTLPKMNDREALDLVARVMENALRGGKCVSVAVVDDAGHMLAFGRHRDAFPASVELAIAKAKTAATFRRDTEVMQQSLEQGRLSYLALPDALPLAGGVPLVAARGTVIGALGVSGAASPEDAELARSAAREMAWAGDSR